MQNPKRGKPQWFCPCDCACCETHPRKLRKITNTNHGNCKHDKTQRPSTQTHACNTGTLENSHKDKSLPRMGRKVRAAQNAVLQTRLQTKLQTRLQSNNAGNQTHSAATLFSAMSSPHTSSSSSSRFSNLSPPRQDFQTWRDGTPIYVIGNAHLLVGLADFVNEVVANAKWLHVSSLLGQ